MTEQERIQKIKAFQTLLGETADGIPGPKTEAAWQALKKPITDSNPSARFTALMPFIYEWEGEVFENDPDDPGGATKYGIDQRSHPEVNIRSLIKSQATAIYWTEWQAAGCESLPSPFAEVFFNCAVNMGLERAREFKQAAGLDSGKFLTLQEAKYRSLATQPKRTKYLKGWLNRTNALRRRFKI